MQYVCTHHTRYDRKPLRSSADFRLFFFLFLLADHVETVIRARAAGGLEREGRCHGRELRCEPDREHHPPHRGQPRHGKVQGGHHYEGMVSPFVRRADYCCCSAGSATPAG